MLIMCILCACNSTEDIQKENIIIQEASIIKEELDIYSAYEELNKASLNIDSINLFCHVTEEDIYEYSEQVKGKYIPVSNNEGIFPISLIGMLEEALYNLRNFDAQTFMEDIIESNYFDTIKGMGADDYRIDLEELYQLFPELYERKNEIDNVYQAYEFINSPKNCIEMFHIDEVGSYKDTYVFVYKSGGTDGVYSVLITRKNNDGFISLCEFETQNSGYGRVIKYEDSFYYIFLQYNYKLKIYDAIRIHKLGTDADTENILIRYLPEKYIWKNIYTDQISPSSHINDYIQSVRDTVDFEQYLENGNTEAAQLFWGDETEDNSFPLTDEYNQYHKIDFTNTSIPIYIRKSAHVPSNYRTTWHLKSKFYIYDTETNMVIELEKLELGEQYPLKNALVQIWFKKIDGKVFTFILHHISDYNYMLNVMLIEEGVITIVRTDIISPQREFVLTEGEVFKAY